MVTRTLQNYVSILLVLIETVSLSMLGKCLVAGDQHQ
jgi:hypothetical protein